LALRKRLPEAFMGTYEPVAAGPDAGATGPSSSSSTACWRSRGGDRAHEAQRVAADAVEAVAAQGRVATGVEAVGAERARAVLDAMQPLDQRGLVAGAGGDAV